MEISVCVGSSCHLKGSYDIITLMKENIAKYHLEDQVNLKAAFCLGNCTNGVSVKIDDQVLGVKADAFDQFFEEHVLKAL